MYNDENATTFLDAINKYAQQQKEEILEEIENFKAKELEKAELDALKNSYKLIQTSIEKVRREIAGETSAFRLENKKKLLKQREKISDDVFFLVAKKLIDFRKTDDYLKWLTKKVDLIIKVLGRKDLTFYLNKGDMSYSDKLKEYFEKKYKQEYEIKTDDSIKIGGIKCSNKNKTLFADETFDSKLKNQRDWFEENSGLHI